jgi:hypothetical protein
MAPLSRFQFPALRFVSQNEPSDDGPIWSAFHLGQFYCAHSELALLRAVLENTVQGQFELNPELALAA